MLVVSTSGDTHNTDTGLAVCTLFWGGVYRWGLWLVTVGASQWLLAVFALAIGVAFIAELCLPYEPQWNRPAWATDAGLSSMHWSMKPECPGLLALPLLTGLAGDRAPGRAPGHCWRNCCWPS